MTKRRFGRILVALLLACLVVAAGTSWFVTRTPTSTFDGVANVETRSAELIARGEYAARVSDCVACHSTPNSAPFAGGLEMATPMGAIFATNITPDKETGIGTYSLADFDRALRQGVARDGHRLYPAMPYPSYAKLGVDDVRALYAYFMHGVQPVRQENRQSEIPWPMNMRWPLALWNAVFVKPRAYEVKASGDALWNRGAYVVQGAGHCGSCHTPRGVAMNEKALDESSALYLSGALLDGWFAPSLRGDVNTGLGRWSEDEIFHFLRTGRGQHGVVFGSMAEVFNNSTQYMTDGDLRAVAHYLKSLPGDPKRDGQPWQYDTASNSHLVLERRLRVPGAQTYMVKCSSCHGVDGRGQGQWIPSLAGSTASMATEDASSINVTLNGSARVVASGVPDAYRMPPFRKQLSDQDIADVLTFVRTSWGNKGGAVHPADVEQLRERTNPASSNVIVLQMR
ncbi:cytochrome c [Paraburkholderia phymatum]|uniref:Gluconate 2-dehydrogenase (Acceptor) n=1 Tax=Paraburkholderia phymatum (strain DSM 17167 / CIP 108236 / LMG 21445 / STM815) TaxID=391038 RepID=B2JTB4_PARP8|nr:cytochrome c [Paraburkholderia phymatum]ACC75817.1 Gluconate 2-dehydrogenase (acceptor) [Paraburkholderia phymatum STM815]